VMSDEQSLSSEKNTLRSGLSHGLKRVNPRQITDDIVEGDRRYVAGYMLGYLLKICLVLGPAYLGLSAGIV